MTWGRRKLGPKITKKPAFPLFPFSCFPVSLLQLFPPLPQLPSLVRIPINPDYIPPWTPAPPKEADQRLNSHRDSLLSSPSSLPLLSADFLFFLFQLQPPQSTQATRTSSHFMSGQWQQLLFLCKVASHFTPPVNNFCNCLVACRTSTITVYVSAEIINMGGGPNLIRPRPYAWAGFGPPQREKTSGPRLAPPFRAAFSLGCAWPIYLGRPGPHVLIIFN